MKQSATIESEMMLYFKSITGSKSSNDYASLPGKHVINNIMNYARSIQVLKSKDGDSIFLVGN